MNHPQQPPRPARKLTPRLAVVPREDPSIPSETETTPVPSGDELAAMPERERWGVVSAFLKETRETRTAVAAEGAATRAAIGDLSEQIGKLGAADAKHAKKARDLDAADKALADRIGRTAATSATIKTLGGAVGVGVVGAFAHDPKGFFDVIRTIFGG